MIHSTEGELKIVSLVNIYVYLQQYMIVIFHCHLGCFQDDKIANQVMFVRVILPCPSLNITPEISSVSLRHAILCHLTVQSHYQRCFTPVPPNIPHVTEIRIPVTRVLENTCWTIPRLSLALGHEERDVELQRNLYIKQEPRPNKYLLIEYTLQNIYLLLAQSLSLFLFLSFMHM